MSATGRSSVRHPDDFYSTPPWVTRSILPHLRSPSRTLDPCAGVGAILGVLGSLEYENAHGFELDVSRADSALATTSASVTCRDALSDEPWGAPDLVITNPPFSLAMEFVTRALHEIDLARGDIAMLLRLNWLASQGRRALHIANPSDVYVLPRRPSFTGKGTDSTEYAWFVWGPGRGNRWFLLDEPSLFAVGGR